MKHELDALMHASDLQALFVVGGDEYNPARDYLTHGAHVTKRR
jgi:hypothetical protein